MKKHDPFLIDSYDYDLPSELIAQVPAERRDDSRLMVLDRSKGTIEHQMFRDLPHYLDSDDLLVLNNTRVIRARLLGHRILNDPKTGKNTQGGKIEFLLLEPKNNEKTEWEGVMASTARQVPGVRFSIPISSGGELVGELIQGSSFSDSGTVIARFDRDPTQSGAGELPLPHYIERSKPSDEDDTRYNTVYAKEPGSAAAPTAGLHFTREIFDQLMKKGVNKTEVTLHVGLGTFRPVKVKDVREHPMHEERYLISRESAAQISSHKNGGGRIVCVGTTSARTIESAFDPVRGEVREGANRTRLFLRPEGESRFQVTDRLITNFHLPKSTLLMLVCAFAGSEFAMRAYREAVQEKYRFFSYGDSMLIL